MASVHMIGASGRECPARAHSGGRQSRRKIRKSCLRTSDFSKNDQDWFEPSRRRFWRSCHFWPRETTSAFKTEYFRHGLPLRSTIPSNRNSGPRSGRRSWASAAASRASPWPLGRHRRPLRRHRGLARKAEARGKKAMSAAPNGSGRSAGNIDAKLIRALEFAACGVRKSIASFTGTDSDAMVRSRRLMTRWHAGGDAAAGIV